MTLRICPFSMFCLLHNQIAFGEITAVLTPISQPEANRSMEIYKEKAFLVFANFLNHQRLGGIVIAYISQITSKLETRVVKIIFNFDASKVMKLTKELY